MFQIYFFHFVSELAAIFKFKAHEPNNDICSHLIADKSLDRRITKKDASIAGFLTIHPKWTNLISLVLNVYRERLYFTTICGPYAPIYRGPGDLVVKTHTYKVERGCFLSGFI